MRFDVRAVYALNRSQVTVIFAFRNVLIRIVKRETRNQPKISTVESLQTRKTTFWKKTFF